MAEQLDQAKAEAFGGRYIGMMNSAFVTLMVDVGHRVGLFEAATRGPATSQELADRVGGSERHVREWLGAMVTGRIFVYEAATKVYTLPPEHAMFLTGNSANNLAPMSQFVSFLGKHVEAAAGTFINGGGLPYSVYRPEFTDLMAAGSALRFDALLVDGYLRADAELTGKMESGASVADIGCGTGHAINVMAQAFPNSSFVGYDLAEDAIATAKAEASELGLANASFAVQDVAELPAADLDVITVFDAIHDQAQPATVLQAVASALKDDGIFLMIDVNASSYLENNLESPIAAFGYAVSALHCMQESLAEGGVGLGTMWGRELAEEMLGEAGFGKVTVTNLDGDILNSIYVCRK